MERTKLSVRAALAVGSLLAVSASSAGAQSPTPYTGENPRHWQSGFLNWKRPPRPVLPQGGEPRLEAVLTCAIGEQGMLSACSIVSETPSGAGFGRAALLSARSAQIDMEKAKGPLPLPRVGDLYTFRVWVQR